MRKLTDDQVRMKVEDRDYRFVRTWRDLSKRFIEIICPAGHDYVALYGNFINQGLGCRACYLERRQLEAATPAQVRARIRKWKTSEAGRASAARYARKPEVKKRMRRHYAARLTRDPIFRLEHQMRARVNKALARNQKAATTMALVGCTRDELRAHLEARFQPGMGWDNYGYYGWHVDHIRPLASFDLTDPEQQRAAFHYSNCQPLWRRQNQEKGDRC